MITYPELIKKLKAIKKAGYIKTHRAGNTGIGKTVEDLLGITENNVPGPNAAMIELKSARKKCFKYASSVYKVAPSTWGKFRFIGEVWI